MKTLTANLTYDGRNNVAARHNALVIPNAEITFAESASCARPNLAYDLAWHGYHVCTLPAHISRTGKPAVFHIVPADCEITGEPCELTARLLATPNMVNPDPLATGKALISESAHLDVRVRGERLNYMNRNDGKLPAAISKAEKDAAACQAKLDDAIHGNTDLGCLSRWLSGAIAVAIESAHAVDVAKLDVANLSGGNADLACDRAQLILDKREREHAENRLWERQVWAGLGWLADCHGDILAPAKTLIRFRRERGDAVENAKLDYQLDRQCKAYKDALQRAFDELAIAGENLRVWIAANSQFAGCIANMDSDECRRAWLIAERQGGREPWGLAITPSQIGAQS